VSDQSDGIGEAVDGGIKRTLAITLVLAAMLIRDTIRRLAEQARMRAEADEAVREALREALEGQRALALARLRPLAALEGWTDLTQAQLVQAWGTAVAWREVEALESGPAGRQGEFDQLVDALRTGFRELHGIDVERGQVIDGEVLKVEYDDPFPPPALEGGPANADPDAPGDHGAARGEQPPPAIDAEAREASDLAQLFQALPPAAAVARGADAGWSAQPTPARAALPAPEAVPAR